MKKSPAKTAQRRPLPLERETIALLAPSQLTEVVGGSFTGSSLTSRTIDPGG
jgi:hypothetical protein